MCFISLVGFILVTNYLTHQPKLRDEKGFQDDENLVSLGIIKVFDSILIKYKL